jgi:hypothetical protein
MSEAALKQATYPELKALAQEIINGQSAEITEMERYLHEWYGEASTRDAADDAAHDGTILRCALGAVPSA